ncbi:hypothetical protein BGZ72_001098 [Mortierella alpina]|nr:hypothetical protein BGZ72_001098 [Mortierella alpina]
MASDLREKATALNLDGKAVTLNRLHKYIKESWPSSYGIPGRETIHKMMCTMGFQYKNVGTTRRFVDTPEIRGLRREYPKRRYSDEFKDALFSWFVPGMTVLRKNATNRGRRYVIVHAGSADRWIGTPRVWEAKSGGDDYHSNMNSDIFEAYMKDLCDDCQSRGYSKVVFCMDTAAYHRRLVQNPKSERTRRKTLSHYKKDELVEHLLWQDSSLVKDDLKKLTKVALYDMAKRPEYRAPFAVQQLVQEYGYHVL